MVEQTDMRAHEFRLGLGHPVLEFLATLAQRQGEPLERLAEPDDLDRWLQLARLADRPRCNARLLARARELREAIYRLVSDVRDAQPADPADIELINRWARKPAPSPQLDASMDVQMVGSDPCQAALAQLARAAIELVAGDQLQRIRNCANPTCSLMFIDHSRPGRRRWCSMERCGNRAKTSRYRRRRQRTRST